MKLNFTISTLSFTQEGLFENFEERHQVFRSEYRVWTLPATKRRLISSFWFKNVLLDNFLTLALLGILLTWTFHISRPIENLLIPALPASILAFAVLFASLYYPAYHNDFLPQLENWIENHKGLETEGIQACKKQQHSVVALMLIEITIQQLAGMTAMINSTSTGLILARKYGISSKSVNSALNLILRGTWDRKSVRKRTEILDDFESAKEHFKLLAVEKAILLLDRRQQKLLQETVN